jgi:putative ABC transport system permease protein
MVPALYGSGEKLGDSMRTGGVFLGRMGRDSRLLRNLFVICEVALALVLLIGAGLTSRSFQRLYAVDPGFKPDNVLTLPVTLPERVYDGFPAYTAFFDQVLERVRVLPGVQQAAVVTTLPMTGSTLNFEITPEGRPQPAPGEELYADYDIVSAGYFQGMGIPLKAGRAFTDQDTVDAPPVCVINETMARRFWRGENPIGTRLRIGDHGPNPRTIVGIVGDVRHGGLDEEPTASVFVPYRQRSWSEMTLVVRASGNPAGLTGALRREVWAVDKDLPLPQGMLMDQVMARATSQRRFSVLLLGIFAVVALVLAATGIYGMLSYLVNERQREISIRIALGAGYGETRRLILRQGLVLTFAGLAFGLVLAFFLTRLLTHLLFEVSATDPMVFITVSLTLLAVAFAASYIPSLRAVRISPLIALKEG